MPELPIFVVSAVLVITAVLLLRRKPHEPVRDEPQRLDVQNHLDD